MKKFKFVNPFTWFFGLFKRAPKPAATASKAKPVPGKFKCRLNLWFSKKKDDTYLNAIALKHPGLGIKISKSKKNAGKLNGESLAKIIKQIAKDLAPNPGPLAGRNLQKKYNKKSNKIGKTITSLANRHATKAPEIIRALKNEFSDHDARPTEDKFALIIQSLCGSETFFENLYQDDNLLALLSFDKSFLEFNLKSFRFKCNSLESLAISKAKKSPEIAKCVLINDLFNILSGNDYLKDILEPHLDQESSDLLNKENLDVIYNKFQDVYVFMVLDFSERLLRRSLACENFIKLLRNHTDVFFELFAKHPTLQEELATKIKPYELCKTTASTYRVFSHEILLAKITLSQRIEIATKQGALFIGTHLLEIIPIDIDSEAHRKDLNKLKNHITVSHYLAETNHPQKCQKFQILAKIFQTDIVSLIYSRNVISREKDAFIIYYAKASVENALEVLSSPNADKLTKETIKAIFGFYKDDDTLLEQIYKAETFRSTTLALYPATIIQRLLGMTSFKALISDNDCVLKLISVFPSLEAELAKTITSPKKLCTNENHTRLVLETDSLNSQLTSEERFEVANAYGAAFVAREIMQIIGQKKRLIKAKRKHAAQTALSKSLAEQLKTVLGPQINTTGFADNFVQRTANNTVDIQRTQACLKLVANLCKKEQPSLATQAINFVASFFVEKGSPYQQLLLCISDLSAKHALIKDSALKSLKDALFFLSRTTLHLPADDVRDIFESYQENEDFTAPEILSKTIANKALTLPHSNKLIMILMRCPNYIARIQKEGRFFEIYDAYPDQQKALLDSVGSAALVCVDHSSSLEVFSRPDFLSRLSFEERVNVANHFFQPQDLGKYFFDIVPHEINRAADHETINALNQVISDALKKDNGITEFFYSDPRHGNTEKLKMILKLSNNEFDFSPFIAAKRTDILFAIAKENQKIAATCIRYEKREGKKLFTSRQQDTLFQEHEAYFDKQDDLSFVRERRKAEEKARKAQAILNGLHKPSENEIKETLTPAQELTFRENRLIKLEQSNPLSLFTFLSAGNKEAQGKIKEELAAIEKLLSSSPQAFIKIVSSNYYTKLPTTSVARALSGFTETEDGDSFLRRVINSGFSISALAIRTTDELTTLLNRPSAAADVAKYDYDRMTESAKAAKIIFESEKLKAKLKPDERNQIANKYYRSNDILYNPYKKIYLAFELTKDADKKAIAKKAHENRRVMNSTTDIDGNDLKTLMVEKTLQALFKPYFKPTASSSSSASRPSYSSSSSSRPYTSGARPSYGYGAGQYRQQGAGGGFARTGYSEEEFFRKFSASWQRAGGFAYGQRQGGNFGQARQGGYGTGASSSSSSTR